MSWVIFLNIISVFTGLAGVIISIIALTKKNGRLKAMAVIGLIMNSLGMIYSILSWASMYSNEVYKFMTPIFDLLY